MTTQEKIRAGTLVGTGLLGAGLTGYILGGYIGIIDSLSLVTMLYAIAASVLSSI